MYNINTVFTPESDDDDWMMNRDETDKTPKYWYKLKSFYYKYSLNNTFNQNGHGFIITTPTHEQAIPIEGGFYHYDTTLKTYPLLTKFTSKFISKAPASSVDHGRKQIIVYGGKRNIFRYKFNESFTDKPLIDIIECPKLGPNATMFIDRYNDTHLF